MKKPNKISLSLEQIYPKPGSFGLNTCSNPDCPGFGVPFEKSKNPLPRRKNYKRCPTAELIHQFHQHGPKAYALRGADKKRHGRKVEIFEFAEDPLEWTDHRTMECLTMLRSGEICETRCSLLSEDHLIEEIDRLRNMNGVLDGAACQCCGKRYLDAPEEFVLNGTHRRTKDHHGNPIKTARTPEAVRVIHKPCKGKPGARFTISVAHRTQQETKDNVRILLALLNSAGVLDIQRILGSTSMGRKIGVGRIYDRIFWLEAVLLAYEREMLRRWRKKMEAEAAKGRERTHRLCHDDMVINVNWETSTDPRNTQLNCSVTADADSGYVYRFDVDFDPRVEPLAFFKKAYLDENGDYANLRRYYRQKSGKEFSVPLLSWQRPTGRLHESQFFAACINELQVFRDRLENRHPTSTDEEKDQFEALRARVDDDIATVTMVGKHWFGFEDTSPDSRGSFRGMTTRDTYTKGAHFALVKEMLPPGKIVLTTEQEATLPNILPQIFREEIKKNRFTWLAMTMNKTASKPERIAKVSAYKKAFKEFHNDGMYAGRFTTSTPIEEVSKAYIAEKMKPAHRGPSNKPEPFPIPNFQGSAFPLLWMRSPSQSSGEIDKVVGFPIVDPWLRYRLKKLPFMPGHLDDEIREDLAQNVWNATLQAASTFMGSVRERLEAARRTDSGGARTGGTYRPGGIFNPKVLIAILNIYRIHYNFFEPRPYVAPTNTETESKVERRRPQTLRYPGTEELIAVMPVVKRTPIKRTPAMRHGMDAFIKEKVEDKKTGKVSENLRPPDIHRVLYRPWLYASTPVGKKLDRSQG